MNDKKCDHGHWREDSCEECFPPDPRDSRIRELEAQLNVNDNERMRCMALAATRGDFVCGDDGYFVYWPCRVVGALGPHHLRWLADELDRLNAPYDKQLHDFLETKGTDNEP
jgi:hypothetical protein